MLAMFAVPVHADTLSVSSDFAFSQYGSGSFAFLWDTDKNVVLGDTIGLSFQTLLKPFTLGTFATFQFSHAPNPYPFIEWGNVDGDSFELALQDNFGGMFPALGTYSETWGGAIELWHDHSEEFPVTGSLTVSPVSTVKTPEPSLLSMLAVTLTLLGGLLWRNGLNRG